MVSSNRSLFPPHPQLLGPKPEWRSYEGDRKDSYGLRGNFGTYELSSRCTSDIEVDSIWEDRKHGTEEMFCNRPDWGVIFDRQLSYSESADKSVQRRGKAAGRGSAETDDT